MKIRFYKDIDGGRWVGFVLAMVAAYILSDANPATQWIGWSIATVSCTMWIWFAYKD